MKPPSAPTPALPAPGSERLNTSQALKAEQRLREMILAGELPAGTRIAELALVGKLGVSRTPVRAALQGLEQEGLLDRLDGGGYAVRTFSEKDVADAIELRGTMEGLAARVAAERGVRAELLEAADACLDAIDTVLQPRALDEEGFSRYVTLNARFHELLAAMASSTLLTRELERIKGLPFASPSAFVVAQQHSPQARDMLVIAQDHHRQVLDAVRRREGTRADALMREHSRLAQRNLREMLLEHAQGVAPKALPALTLIRRS